MSESRSTVRLLEGAQHLGHGGWSLGQGSNRTAQVMSANSGLSRTGLLGWDSIPASHEMEPPLPIPGQLGVAGSCRVFLCHLGCMCVCHCACVCVYVCICDECVRACLCFSTWALQGALPRTHTAVPTCGHDLCAQACASGGGRACLLSPSRSQSVYLLCASPALSQWGQASELWPEHPLRDRDPPHPWVFRALWSPS